MNFDQASIGLLLAGDVAGLRRLAEHARHSLPGKGEPCARCGNDSYQLYDGIRECDNCGLGEGEACPDEPEALDNDVEDGLR